MSKEVASLGERHAATFLEENGWEIVARNWTEPKIGEIDLVAAREIEWGDGRARMLAIVEVKATAQRTGIAPEVHVNDAKRRKLVTLAKLFVARHKIRGVLVRFDVIGVDLSPFAIRHYPDAFDASARVR